MARIFDGHNQIRNTVAEFYIFEYFVYANDLQIESFLDWVRCAPLDEVYENIEKRNLLPCFRSKNLYPGIWQHAVPEYFQQRDPWYELEFKVSEFLDQFGQNRGEIESIGDLVRCWLSTLGTMPPWRTDQVGTRWLIKCADFNRTVAGAIRFGLLGQTAFHVRDPLDIVNSIKRRRQSEPHREFHVFELLEICHDLESIPPLIRKMGDMAKIVRYEELDKDADAVVLGICEFWGISYSEKLKAPTMFGNPWIENSSFFGRENREDILTATERNTILKNTSLFRDFFGYQDVTVK